MIYSVQDYNITFVVECQGENGSLFYFVRFAQIQSIIYSRLTSKNIPFFIICAVVFNRDHCEESCALSRNSSPSQKTVKNCCPIYKKAAEDTSTMGRVLGGICLSGLGFLGGVLFRSLAYGIFFSRFAANISVILQTLFSWYVP